MSDIAADDMQTRGISALETALDKDDDAIIRVRIKGIKRDATLYFEPSGQRPE
jgi:hypothetical protein